MFRVSGFTRECAKGSANVNVIEVFHLVQGSGFGVWRLGFRVKG